MLSNKRSLMVLTSLFVLSCASSSHDEGTGKQGASVTLDGATDPVTHLTVLGGASMEGRGTGAAGFNRAADYVANECRTAGVMGAGSESSESPYFQPFRVNSFTTLPEIAPPVEGDFGSDVFEEGLFVSGEASTRTIVEMNQALCAAYIASGKPCPEESATGTTDPRPQMQANALATQNVVALLPGTGPRREEIILLSAHLDHLGKTSSGTYFGADDNGSGSSALLALMHRLSQAQPFDRTIAFLWTAGEEKGLLGAAYFVDNPPAKIPLAKIKQVVNMDMVGAWDDTRVSLGLDNLPGTSDAAALFDAANLEMSRPFAKINRDVQQYANRQDGYAFTRRRVPSLFVFEGLSKPAGGGSLMARYHKTSDTVEALLAETNGSKIRRVVDILAITVRKLANPPSP